MARHAPQPRTLFRRLLAIAMCASAAPGLAGELGVLAGGARSDELGRHSYAWAIDYQQNLSPYLALGGSWVNEGHAANNHRDGAALQLRARASVIDPRLTLTAGIGPLYYFNTTRANEEAPDFVDHGWGLMYSFAATWELGNAWYLQARFQHVESPNGFDTTSVLLGGGYRFGPRVEGPFAGSLAAENGSPRHEISGFAGRVITNTFQSETGSAQAIEYRGRLIAPLEWTVTALNEGNTGVVDRNGIAAQIWGVSTLGSERLSAGAGIGAYLLLKQHRNDSQGDSADDRYAGFVSMTIAYAVSPSWQLRFIFNRVLAHHLPDTDVLLLGAGYRF